MSEEISENDFIDLLADHAAGRRTPVHPTNIIKAGRVTPAGARQVEVSHVLGGDPKVILHRDGDIVQGVEFICTCGRTASLSIQYEGE